MKKISENRPLLSGGIITAVLAVIFLLVFFKDALISPNSYLFGWDGDGVKNYYTYTYHVVHDTSYVYFQGMNYPYGELHSFTDGNPFFANTVRLIYKIFPATKKYLIGIYNLWMLGGFVLASVFLFLLIYRFTKNFSWSVLGGLSIIILSPQWARIGGHYSLATAFVIPMSWYYLLEWHLEKKIKYLLLLSVLSIIWFFIHPYLGIMIAMFSGGFCFLHLFSKRERRWSLAGIFPGSVLPVLFYLLYVKIFDYHEGRPDSAWGFFSYNASVDSVFFWQTPLNLLGYIKPPTRLTWEGKAYVGIVSSLGLIILLFRYLLRRKLEEHLPVSLQKFLAVSVIILLFSMSFPFSLYPPIVEKIPFLAQFRSVGRFAWVFYYVLNVSVWVFFYQFSRRYFEKTFWIPFLFTGIYFIENTDALRLLSKSIVRTPNYFETLPTSLQSLSRINAKQYQAILPFPFFYIGSGSLNREGREEIRANTLLASYHTGLPTFASQSSRASLKETLKLYEMISSPGLRKQIGKDFTCQNKILVFSDGKELGEFEEYYYHKSKPLTELFGELECRTLLEPDTSFRELPKDTLFYLSFDSLETPIKFRGKGAYYVVKNRENILGKFKGLPAGKYVVTFWEYYEDISNITSHLERMLIEKSAERLKISTIDGVRGKWVRFFKEFEAGSNEEVKLLFGKTRNEVIIDELLLYRKR